MSSATVNLIFSAKFTSSIVIPDLDHRDLEDFINNVFTFGQTEIWFSLSETSSVGRKLRIRGEHPTGNEVFWIVIALSVRVLQFRG